MLACKYPINESKFKRNAKIPNKKKRTNSINREIPEILEIIIFGSDNRASMIFVGTKILKKKCVFIIDMSVAC